MMVHTHDHEKLKDDDSAGCNNETVKSLKARYKKLFTTQKDSTFFQVWHLKENIKLSFVSFLFIDWQLQNQLEDKYLQLEDSDKARKVALKKLVE